MPRGYNRGYGEPRGYQSSYQYQQPAAVQYQSFFNPIPLDFLQQQFDRKQGAYDQAFAGVMAAKEKALQEEIALGDAAHRNELIQNTLQDIDKVTDEKYGGDYGRAAKDIANKITDLRGNQFWQSSKYLKGQQELQQKFMLQNPNAHLYTNVLNMGAVDPATGRVRSQEEITFDAEKHGDWQTSVEKQFADLKGDRLTSLLERSGITGYHAKVTKEDLKPEDIVKLLDDNPGMVEAFMENNKDFARSKTRLGGLGTGETFEEAKAYILGNILDKPYSRTDITPFRDLSFDPDSGGGTPPGVPGQPRLVRGDTLPFPVDEETLRTRREGTVKQVLGDSLSSEYAQAIKEQDPEKYKTFRTNANTAGRMLTDAGIVGSGNDDLISKLITKATLHGQNNYSFDDFQRDLKEEGLVEENYDKARGSTNYKFPQTGTQHAAYSDYGKAIEPIYTHIKDKIFGDKDYINSLAGEETFQADVFTPSDRQTRNEMFDYVKDNFFGIKDISEIQEMGLEVWKSNGKEPYTRNKSRMNNKVNDVMTEIEGLSAEEMAAYRIATLPGDANDPPRIVINTPSGDQLRLPLIGETKPGTRKGLLEIGTADNPFNRFISNMETPELVNSVIDYTVHQHLNDANAGDGVPMSKVMGGGSKLPGEIYRRGPSQYEYILENDEGEPIAHFKGSTPSDLFRQLGVDMTSVYLDNIASSYATPKQKQTAAFAGVTSMDQMRQIMALREQQPE